MWVISSIAALFIYIMILQYYKRNKKIRLIELQWLYSNEKYETAIAYMERSLDVNPNSYFLNNEIAFCLINLGKPKEAIKYLEKALENMPDDAYSAFCNMAWAFYELNDLEKCLHYSEMALNKDSNAKLALTCKGNSMMRQNNNEMALVCFNNAIEQDENFGPAVLGKAHCLTNLKDYDSAISFYEKYCRLKPRKLSALNELANALYRKQRYEEVIEIFDKIISLDDKQLRAYCDKAHVLSCIGKFDEAVKCLNFVLTVEPEYALAHYFMARIYSHLRHREEAFKCLETAFSLNPELKTSANQDVNLNNLKFFSEFYELLNRA